MDDADCIDCHSGHATDNPGLLVESFGETCLTCHDKIRHESEHAPYLTSSCEACHRNHSSLPSLLAGPVTATCGRCHEEQLKALDAQHKHEAVEGEDCLSCHEAHGGRFRGLLVQSQQELCSDCHDIGDLVVELEHGGDEVHATGLHAPVAEGSCSGCHDAHGSKFANLLKRESENLCYGCHVQEKIDFAAGRPHDPVAKGECNKCHTPHGSTGRQLAAMTEPSMCTQCHDFNDAALANRHRGYDVSESRCSSCHTPHSSSVDNLLNAFTHDPFAEQECDACHEGRRTGGAIAAASLDACFDCHDEKTEEAGHQHVGGVSCIDCHQPHAAAFEALLGDHRRTCTRCHEDVLRGDGIDVAHLHGPIEEGSCLECHQMHEPNAASYLVTTQRELCANCHESVQAHVASQTLHAPFARGECSKCHATHVSANMNLLAVPEQELCATCHNYADPAMKTAHRNYPLSGAGCSSCHDPHGTEKAGSALVLSNLHSPYEDNECDVCHDANGAVTISPAGCADCHDSDDNFASTHNGGRSVTERNSVGVCLDCHSPHAGHDGLLVRESMSETCLGCHERGGFERANVHAALEEGCNVCHDVHNDNTATLRGVSVDQLCYDCHEDKGEHIHPVGADYKDPRSGKAMTCMSCHEPHSSDFEHITTFDHNRDLCVQCHASGTMRVQR
jgi:predicted CXXCH cytochrome family protein